MWLSKVMLSLFSTSFGITASSKSWASLLVWRITNPSYEKLVVKYQTTLFLKGS